MFFKFITGIYVLVSVFCLVYVSVYRCFSNDDNLNIEQILSMPMLWNTVKKRLWHENSLFWCGWLSLNPKQVFSYQYSFPIVEDSIPFVYLLSLFWLQICWLFRSLWTTFGLRNFFCVCFGIHIPHTIFISYL
jgi:hypothetical protein